MFETIRKDTMSEIKDIIQKLYFNPISLFSDRSGLMRLTYLLPVIYIFSSFKIMDLIYKNIVSLKSMTIYSRYKYFVVLSANSWTDFWFLSLFLALIISAFVWYWGGWWYKIRIRLSGDRSPDENLARAIYVYAALIYAGPAFIILVSYTFIYDNLAEATINDSKLTILIFTLIIWSLIAGYKGVISNFNVKPHLAKLWFVILPFSYYVYAMKLIRYISQMFLNT